MVTDQADKGEMMGSGEDVFSIELPSPKGWTKKFFPKTSGTPRRNEIVFISPTGEEIKHKKQLDQYLKSHPGGPTSSEFDWGTGDSPRRSARLSSKIKASETPQSGSSQKRQRKLISKKPAKDEHDTDTDGEGKPAQKDEEMAPATAEEKPKDLVEVEMKGTEDKSKAEGTTKDAPVESDAVKKSDQKTKERAEETTIKKPEERVDIEKLLKEQVSEPDKVEEKLEKQHGKVVDGENPPKGKDELKKENAVEAKEKQVDSQVPEEAPKTADGAASAENKDEKKEKIPSDSDSKAEKNVEQENSDKEEKATAGEVGVDTDRAKDNEEAAKNTESRSSASEAAPREPNAPPISC